MSDRIAKITAGDFYQDRNEWISRMMTNQCDLLYQGTHINDISSPGLPMYELQTTVGLEPANDKTIIDVVWFDQSPEPGVGDVPEEFRRANRRILNKNLALAQKNAELQAENQALRELCCDVANQIQDNILTDLVNKRASKFVRAQTAEVIKRLMEPAWAEMKAREALGKGG